MGALADWELSEALDAGTQNPGSYPNVHSLKWQKVEAENPGMVVIQRYRRDPNVLPPSDQPGATTSRSLPDRIPGSKFVFAKMSIHSDANQTRKMHIGYSDEVVVYLNGHPLYAGNNAYHAREEGFLGLINSDNDVVYLPLRKGDNELVLAVTEFFGGWAFLCRLEPVAAPPQLAAGDVVGRAMRPECIHHSLSCLCDLQWRIRNSNNRRHSYPHV